MLRFVDFLGKSTITLIKDIIDIGKIILTALYMFFFQFSVSQKAIRTIMLKQIYFTGIEAFSIISWTAVLVGMVIVTQAVSILPLIGGERLIGDILILVVIRELGPIFAGIIVIARSGTAIAAELGSMKVNNEVMVLEAMGIDPKRYLVMPRVIGTMFSVLILTFYFEVITVLGGYFLAGFGQRITFNTYISSIMESLTFTEVFVSLLKSMIFGLVIGSVAAYHGLRVGTSITQVPQEATKAVIRSLFILFAVDAILTTIFFAR